MCINFLSDIQPTDVDHNDESTAYFKHTYIRGRRKRGRSPDCEPPLLCINVWDQHDKGAEDVTRTTNSVEGWHRGLQALPVDVSDG